ncbi:MAG: site-specific integrase [Oscillospiraceae bacterium]|nr:site-specific integrase [Oscillospiraceae bacterium]
MKIPKATQSSDGTWVIQLRIDGKSLYVRADTEAKVQAKALAIKSGLIEAHKTKQEKTLGQMIDEYIEARTNVLSPATITGYRKIRRTRFLIYMDRTPDKINWQSAINLEAKSVSSKTLKNSWGLINAVLRDNEISVNVTLPPVEKHPQTWLTPEQIPVFIKAVQDKPCELAALLGLCSLRRSEIVALNWQDVNLQKKTVYVHAAVVPTDEGLVRKSTKTTGSTREVPLMIPRLEELLESSDVKSGPLITVHPETIYRQVNDVCKEAGLPEVGMHGLRRSFASLGYHLGLTELEIMAIGGWSDFQTVHKFYLYLSEKDKQSAGAKIAEFFSNCL